MQGSVWGSLKCTSSMDILNKNILEQKDLTYKFRGDPDIEIGVLGMVDDNLAISKCGTYSVMKNAVINSFLLKCRGLPCLRKKCDNSYW